MRTRHYFRNISPYAVIGLEGVCTKESERVRRAGKAYGYSVWVVALCLLFQWHYESYDLLTHFQLRFINIIIWLYLLLTFAYFCYQVKDKKRYLVSNWLLPFLLLLGLPTFVTPNHISDNLADLRPLLALYLLIPSLSLLWRFFIDGKLQTTLIAAGVIVCFFGVLISSIDPNIHSVWDGIWWALATISTVGYGDVVPTSPLGRIIGGVLVIVGIGVFVTITANFLALVLSKEDDQVKELSYQIEKLNERLDQMDGKHSNVSSDDKSKPKL